jgi:cation/acetate symporter
VAGTDRWVGGVVVGAVVLVNVFFGGMRSITFVQAFQYWLKLTALLLPALFLLGVWVGDGALSPADALVDGGRVPSELWAAPLEFGNDYPLYTIYSLILATFLGTMGLPHVVVRFYTNPDGRAARRTTLVVLGLLGLFYVLPPVYGALGRLYAPDLVETGRTDAVVLELPARMVAGLGGELLSALTAAGAFAAFLSTSSGLTIAVAGVISQDVMGRTFRGVRAFQSAAVVAVSAPLVMAVVAENVSVARLVGLAFAVAASTFCPLLVLGIWWRRLTAVGAVTGMAVGGLLSVAAVVTTLVGGIPSGWIGAVVAQPAAVTVPVAFVTMILVSLATGRHTPPHVAQTMVRLHTPETVQLDRGPYPL